MFEFNEPPTGSRIEMLRTIEGLELSWKQPAGSIFGRIFTGLFLTGWLGGWTVGGFFAMGALFFGFGEDETGPGIGGRLFLAFWLCGWLAGEVFAAAALWGILTGPGRTKLVLGDVDILYRYATFNFNRVTENRRSRLSKLWSKGRDRIEKREINNIHVDWAEHRQRLVFDVGANRIEIGADLTEPEREWLAEVLQSWREN